MKKGVYIAILLFLPLFGIGCIWGTTKPDTVGSADIDRDAILLDAKENGLIMNDSEKERMGRLSSVVQDEKTINTIDPKSVIPSDFSGWNTAALADVTGGTSFGLAYAKYDGSTYKLVVKMGGLPELGSDYFYEGWIVNRNSMTVISTGKAEFVDSSFDMNHLNVYLSAEDLTDHNFFVLTLEPNDGDPAPAEHVLEGRIK